MGRLQALYEGANPNHGYDPSGLNIQAVDGSNIHADRHHRCEVHVSMRFVKQNIGFRIRRSHMAGLSSILWALQKLEEHHFGVPQKKTQHVAGQQGPQVWSIMCS